MPSRSRAATSSGVASVSDTWRFLRILDRVLLCLVMASTISGVMPAFTCTMPLSIIRRRRSTGCSEDVCPA